MGIGFFPTPGTLRKYVNEQETAIRCRQMPAQLVDDVFRYGAVVGSSFYFSPSLERGMDHAREMIDDHEGSGLSFASGLVVGAGTLTAGRGRFRRDWHAPDGGLWLTLVLVNTLLPESSRLLPLAAGIACCETVRSCGLAASIKWPNDTMVDGRKVGGILTETMVGPCSGEEYVLVGIGLNVNNNKFPSELVDNAASMAQMAGQDFDLRQVVLDLLAKLSWNIGLLHWGEDQYLANINHEAAARHNFLLSSYRQLTNSIGRRVMFGYDVQEDPQYEAEVLGIDDDGGLILRMMEDDLEVRENSGEILYLQ